MFKKKKLLPLRSLILDRWAKWSFFVTHKTFLLYIDHCHRQYNGHSPQHSHHHHHHHSDHFSHRYCHHLVLIRVIIIVSISVIIVIFLVNIMVGVISTWFNDVTLTLPRSAGDKTKLIETHSFTKMLFLMFRKYARVLTLWF